MVPILAWFLFYVLLHSGVAVLAHLITGRPWSVMFLYLDSEWYQHIAVSGYTPVDFSSNSPIVFFPLWPLLLRVCSEVVGISPYVLGVAGSLLCLWLFLVLVREKSFYKLPNHQMGLFLCLFAPGAWVYCSNHTEALFLWLSALSFLCAGQRRWIAAAVFAGLCALTRNQGVLLAVAIGLANALWHEKQGVKSRVIRFVQTGIIAGSFYGLWLGYLAWLTGNPFASVEAQATWGVAPSFVGYIRNLFWMNPRKLMRALWFWLVLYAAWDLLKKHGSQVLPYSFYLAGSVLLWPLQSHTFAQAYRFGAVLFPFWFWLGEYLEERLRVWRNGSEGWKWLCYSGFIGSSAWIGSWYFMQIYWPY